MKLDKNERKKKAAVDEELFHIILSRNRFVPVVARGKNNFFFCTAGEL
jgi:hypothetical protein